MSHPAAPREGRIEFLLAVLNSEEDCIPLDRKERVRLRDGIEFELRGLLREEFADVLTKPKGER